MKAEIEFSERRLAKAGFSHEAAANTVKTAFRQRGAELLEEDVSLVFEGSEKAIRGVLAGLQKKEWFQSACILCKTEE